MYIYTKTVRTVVAIHNIGRLTSVDCFNELAIFWLLWKFVKKKKKKKKKTTNIYVIARNRKELVISQKDTCDITKSI